MLTVLVWWEPASGPRIADCNRMVFPELFDGSEPFSPSTDAVSGVGCFDAVVLLEVVVSQNIP